ncbi:MAG: hypothetical protein ABEK04_01935 [Candidatus Nanohalobium sp.]
MTDVAVYLEGDDREKFLDRMLIPFQSHEQASKWYPVSQEWIDSYSSGRQQVIQLDTLLQFREVMEEASLELFDRELTEKLDASEETRDSSERPEIRQDWKNYVFNLFENREIAEMTGYAKQTVDNYSPGSENRTPPEGFWEDVDEELQQIYEDTRLSNIEASLVDLGKYGSAHRSIEESSFAEEVSVGELMFLQDMADRYRGFIDGTYSPDTMVSSSYEEIFQQVTEELEKGNNFISPAKYDMDAKKAGLGLKVLDEVGILDQWSSGNGNTYEILQDKGTVEKARRLFSPREYGMRDGIKEAAEEGLDSVDLERLYGPGGRRLLG